VSPADPIVRFRTWWDDARATGEHWSDAMVLATVSPQGWPSARVRVFLGEEWEGRGGGVGWFTPVPDEEADAFFATRPRRANIAAGIAPQGEVIAGLEVLERRMRQILAEFDGIAVGRPTGWGGYVVAPDEIEFWQGRPEHLHDRMRYRRDAGGWRVERLSP
jgi:pyridoxamine 5'-phosphate oxidase